MTSNAYQPRQQTFDLLGRTRNTTALAVLRAGLDSTIMDVRSQCVKLLLARPEVAAREAIVSHWTRLDPDTREGLASKKFELEPACRSILQHGKPGEKQAAITTITDLDMTAVLPELIGLALDRGNSMAETAMQALFVLCDRWGQRARTGRDMPSVRSPMVEAMQRALFDFPAHKNNDIVDAWLVLVSWEDSAYRAVINDPLHPAFRAVLDRFWTSQHQSVLQLLGGCLWRQSTPKSILSILCERPEPDLAFAIATLLDESSMASALRRLKEMPPVVSLQDLAVRPAGVGPDIQRRLWLMLAANSPTVEPVLIGAVTISKMGSADYRRTAADIVRNCRRIDIETLAGHMQNAASNPDDTQSVGAHLFTMLGWIDGPSTVLSAAARDFFSEFTLDRLLEVVRKWPTPLCRALAQVVTRIEPDIIPQLLKALESPAPKRRLMALQVIRLLEVSEEVTKRLLPLVHDPRMEVRVPAIDLVSALGAPELEELLPELLADPTTDVQDAAIRAQRRLERRQRQAAIKKNNEPVESLDSESPLKPTTTHVPAAAPMPSINMDAPASARTRTV